MNVGYHWEVNGLGQNVAIIADDGDGSQEIVVTNIELHQLALYEWLQRHGRIKGERYIGNDYLIVFLPDLYIVSKLVHCCSTDDIVSKIWSNIYSMSIIFIL